MSQIGQLSLILPLAVGLFYVKRLKRVNAALMILLFSSLIISAVAWYLWSLSINNLPLLHLYTVLEFSFWAFIYYWLFEEHQLQKIIIPLSVCFILFALLNSALIQKLTVFNTNSRLVECGLLIFLSVSYYFKIFKEKRIENLEHNSTFWLNAAVLTYFSGSFLLFGFGNALLSVNSNEIREIWGVHGLFLTGHYFLITIGLWMGSREMI